MKWLRDDCEQYIVEFRDPSTRQVRLAMSKETCADYAAKDIADRFRLPHKAELIVRKCSVSGLAFKVSKEIRRHINIDNDSKGYV